MYVHVHTHKYKQTHKHINKWIYACMHTPRVSMTWEGCQPAISITVTALDRRNGRWLRLKRDGTREEARFRLTAKRTIPFKSVGGRQFSRLLVGKLRTSACRVCTVRASLCSAVMWRLLVTHSILLFLLYFSSRASPCATTFQLDSTDDGRLPPCRCTCIRFVFHIMRMWSLKKKKNSGSCVKSGYKSWPWQRPLAVIRNWVFTV